MIKNKRRIFLIGIDVLIYAAVSVAITLLSSFVNKRGLELPANALAYYAVVFCGILLVRLLFGAYSNVWRYANSKAYLQMIFSDFSGALLAVIMIFALGDYDSSFWKIASIVSTFSLLSLASRFVYQQFYRYLNVRMDDINKIGAAIVGAGQVGSMLADELLYNPESHYRPVCFIDNNPIKIGSKIHGLKVYKEDDRIIGRLKELPVQEIFIAIPSLDSDRLDKIRDFYMKTGCKIKLYDFPITENSDINTASKPLIRDFMIEDLLFRSSMKLEGSETADFYKDKVVLVTGGGGSIGSELCRQIAKTGPKKLIILDIYENNAYDIQQELIRAYGRDLTLRVEIASVRDCGRLDVIFEHYKPDIVFHAAAHKHVPLMEHSGGEAIKNNVFGTLNVAAAAEKYGVSKFILISTDKAVNPTNIMGASKRLCEMIVQSRNGSNTSFSAVRFGNVLGSNGSVIPLFKKQIADGGPVTITDKRIIRYFMTIPEAAQLVMTAGAMAKSGELFVLDMGKPVKILDLAENMIRLSGLRPYSDIDIKEVGLRPGEKLYEELLIKTEKLTKTDNNMIFVEKDQPHKREEIDRALEEISKAMEVFGNEIESDNIHQLMKKYVPTYKEPREVNASAAQSDEMKRAADAPALV